MKHIRLGFIALALASSASAQEADPDFGRELFLTYCWQCHGNDAKGNGPMAELLAIATPDLTRLASRNEGLYPVDFVAQKIDGRAPMLAHGGDMPIFGSFLESDQNVTLRLPSGQLIMLNLPLADLVVYLETIQSNQP